MFSAVGLGVLFVLYWPHPKTGVRARLSFGLMIAGMVGNLVDRVFFGHVINFIDIVPWFIFNIADAAILLGIVFFACAVASGRMFSKPRVRESPANAHSARLGPQSACRTALA